MIAEISVADEHISGTILLPASKSISNRVQIIRAICGIHFEIHNLSAANDSLKLQEILSQNSSEINAGDGGTTLRFILAYYCLCGREISLTASESLIARPIAPLVDALKELGANIEYLTNDGTLPLLITPSVLKGNLISISGEISSQFVSALMMIGPKINGGLVIEVTGEILSLPYILMTQSVMRDFGAEVQFENNSITIHEGNYQPHDFNVEPDWSAASYWYEIVALSTNAEVLLEGLPQESLQGDARIAAMMEKLGVKTIFSTKGALLTKIQDFILPEYFTDDFSGCPDLAPAVANVCAALNITADLTGLKNFRLKETDRAAAIQRELYNMNVKSDFCGGSKLKIYAGGGIKLWSKLVKTYNDHRIAMAFAPLALKTGMVLIENPEVVKKSYPGFFEDLIKVGMKVRFNEE